MARPAPFSSPAGRRARSVLKGRAARAAATGGPDSSRRSLILAPGVLSVAAGTGAQHLLEASAAASPAAIATSQVPKRTLVPGLDVSQVIKGCWQLSGGHRGGRGDDRTAGKAAVEDFDAFVSNGVTTFDTADIYGPSESLIGEYLRSRPEKAAGLQICTKSCKFGADLLTVSQKSMSAGVSRSLSRLGLPAVDLVQFFWSDYGVPRYVAASQFLMEEVARGRIRHLGVTNFDTVRVQEMMDSGVKLVSNQVQYSLLDRRPENSMAQLCADTGMKLLPFGTLAGGLMSKKYLGVPVESVSVDTYSKSKYMSVIFQSGGWDWFQRLLGELNLIADKHNSSIANVACRWVLDKPHVAGIILGARNANHVQEHVALGTLSLDLDDLGRIDAVLGAGRQAVGDIYTWERGGRW